MTMSSLRRKFSFKAGKLTLGNRQKRFGYLIVAPSVIILLLSIAYPTFYMFMISFFRWSIIPTLPRYFVGLENYLSMFSDNNFYRSIIATFIFLGGAVTLEFFLGFGLAILLSKSSLRWLRMAYLFPAVIAPVVVGLMWRFMLSFDLGVINYLINLFGFEPVNWLGKPTAAMLSIILVDVWQWTPFVMLIMLAGIESLPAEPFEAALVDGASTLQVFRFLMVPLLLPIITIVLMFRALDAFKAFDIVYMVTRGGPANATDLLSLTIYRKAFFENNLGYAAAESVLMIALATVMTRMFIRLLSRFQRIS